MKRMPFGKHDINKSRASINRTPSWSVSSPSQSGRRGKPPRYGNLKKSKTPAVKAKENFAKPKVFIDGYDDTKTPRISNRVELVTENEHTKLAKRNGGQQKLIRKDKEDALVVRGHAKPSKEAAQSVAHVSTSTKGGRTKVSTSSLKHKSHTSEVGIVAKEASQSVAHVSASRKGGRTKIAASSLKHEHPKSSTGNAATAYLFKNKGTLPKVPNEWKMFRQTNRLNEEGSKNRVSNENRLLRAHEDTGAALMDCDSDENSLGLTSTSSASPSQVDEDIGEHKQWKLRAPSDRQGNTSLIPRETGLEAKNDDSFQKFRAKSNVAVTSTPRETIANVQDAVVTKRMMQAARQAEVDNRNVIDAMLASRPTASLYKGHEDSNSILGSTLKVSNGHSVDGSELTDQTLAEAINNDVSLKRQSRHQPARETEDTRSTAGRNHGHTSRSIQKSTYADNSFQQATEKERKAIMRAWARPKWLPSGWFRKMSKSKHKPYYVHPDHGKTWHCPVVPPLEDSEEHNRSADEVNHSRGPIFRGYDLGSVQSMEDNKLALFHKSDSDLRTNLVNHDCNVETQSDISPYGLHTQAEERTEPAFTTFDNGDVKSLYGDIDDNANLEVNTISQTTDRLVGTVRSQYGKRETGKVSLIRKNNAHTPYKDLSRLKIKGLEAGRSNQDGGDAASPGVDRGYSADQFAQPAETGLDSPGGHNLVDDFPVHEEEAFLTTIRSNHEHSPSANSASMFEHREEIDGEYPYVDGFDGAEDSDQDSRSYSPVHQDKGRNTLGARKSYGTTSLRRVDWGDDLSSGSETGVDTRKTFSYRPSYRIRHPPHPICSLQRLDSLFDPNRKRASSKRKASKTTALEIDDDTSPFSPMRQRQKRRSLKRPIRKRLWQ